MQHVCHPIILHKTRPNDRPLSTETRSDLFNPVQTCSWKMIPMRPFQPRQFLGTCEIPQIHRLAQNCPAMRWEDLRQGGASVRGDLGAVQHGDKDRRPGVAEKAHEEQRHCTMVNDEWQSTLSVLLIPSILPLGVPLAKPLQSSVVRTSWKYWTGRTTTWTSTSRNSRPNWLR